MTTKYNILDLEGEVLDLSVGDNSCIILLDKDEENFIYMGKDDKILAYTNPSKPQKVSYDGKSYALLTKTKDILVQTIDAKGDLVKDGIKVSMPGPVKEIYHLNNTTKIVLNTGEIVVHQKGKGTYKVLFDKKVKDLKYKILLDESGDAWTYDNSDYKKIEILNYLKQKDIDSYDGKVAKEDFVEVHKVKFV